MVFYTKRKIRYEFKMLFLQNRQSNKRLIFKVWSVCYNPRNRLNVSPDKWSLYNRDAPSHAPISVKCILAKETKTTSPVSEHPLLSPDIDKCKFVYVPETKIKLKLSDFE
jgi:hypothetical protein